MRVFGPGRRLTTNKIQGAFSGVNAPLKHKILYYLLLQTPWHESKLMDRREKCVTN